jgi:alkyl hydroperoxide reductase subunit AhpC
MLRAIDSLQLTDSEKAAIPVKWEPVWVSEPL